MKKKAFLLPLLILISLFPLKDLLLPGAYQSHDIIEHAARLASFYESLSQNNPIPRWAGNLNYTYGHPVIMFLYPLTNYLGSFLHFLGFSIINSIKILFGLSYIASGVFMYLWIKRLWGQKSWFLFAAIFYLFAPYRFVDLYVRAALGEHLAFVFIPLVCFLLTELIKKSKNEVKVEEVEIQKELEVLAKQKAKISTVDRAAEKDDQVQVDFEAFKDNVVLENRKS